MRYEERDHFDKPLWRCGPYYAARTEGTADSFVIWEKVGDGQIPVALGKDFAQLRELLDELEAAGADEDWRVRSL